MDSLPFIEAVRTKRNAAGKDVLPDAAFLRLRGALFFGPGFRVTRNKLTFRDNLAQVGLIWYMISCSLSKFTVHHSGGRCRRGDMFLFAPCCCLNSSML